MSTRAPVAPAASAPAARPCTPAAGGLPLGDDLAALAREVSRLDDVVVQLRDQNTRLVVARPLSDHGVTLRLPARAAGPVVGHAGRCECCGSPGRVVVHDARLRETLQVCASADFAPGAWMDLLLDLLPRDGSTAPAAAAPVSWTDTAVLARDPAPARDLCALLNRIWPEKLRLEVELRTRGFALSAPFAPESGSSAGGLLVLRAADATLQLFLGAVARLAVVPSGLDPALEIHTRHAGETLVLRSAAPAWRRALADLADSPV